MANTRKKGKIIDKGEDIKQHLKLDKENESDNIQLVNKDVIETRIRRDNPIEYVNVPSREIKKWFMARDIRAKN